MGKIVFAVFALMAFLVPLSFSQLGCNPGDSQCVDEATYRVCTQQAIWGEIQHCALGAHCANQTGTCQGTGAPVCTPGASQCIGSSTYQVCDNYGQWGGIEQCSGGLVCNDGQCVQPQPECEREGQTRCSPTSPGSLEICNSNLQWIYWKSCASGCYDGQCKGCASGSRQCYNPSNYQICDSHGNWGAPISCPPNYECSGSGNCEVSPEEKCNYPGKLMCSTHNSDLLLRCTENYLWGVQQVCNLGCKANACAVCTYGQTKCQSPNGYAACTSNGQWGYYTDCPTGYYCMSGSCQTVPQDRCSQVGAKRCSPSDANMVQACSSNYVYQDSLRCPIGCNNGTCMECQPGVQVCSGATSFKVCSPAGKLSADNYCPAGFTCTNGACVASPQCNNGARKCASDNIYECANSQWQLLLNCPSDADCVESTGTAYCQQEQRAQNQSKPVQPEQPQNQGGIENFWGVFAGIAIVLAVALGYVLLKKSKK